MHYIYIYDINTEDQNNSNVNRHANVERVNFHGVPSPVKTKHNQLMIAGRGSISLSQTGAPLLFVQFGFVF